MIRYLFAIFFTLAYGNDLQTLKTPISIPKQNIFNIFSPFIIQKPKLEIIINQRAKINGKWYKLHQKFLEYSINEIGKNFVVLENSHQTLTLYTHPPKEQK
ncbi:hypothetical protein [Helicobacter sp. 11S03491-1]|uniref:hypothetical protein n=1 Tax=Helicobacter sp. 11S03491-1 TaxID=1476196 RepID=UPI000BA5AD76|nr:hypothetical protein [Helicobacter sp. 11S03491-1]PAF41164.1 hypothetical protein BKH45_08020 [Helicobacter sp. 11S03491-1]